MVLGSWWINYRLPEFVHQSWWWFCKRTRCLDYGVGRPSAQFLSFWNVCFHSLASVQHRRDFIDSNKTNPWWIFSSLVCRCKYLYLLYDDSFLVDQNYVFTTEGHPLPVLSAWQDRLPEVYTSANYTFIQVLGVSCWNSFSVLSILK